MSPVPINNREDPNKDNAEQYDIESMESPQFIIAQAEDSDSESELDPEQSGYELLPQEPYPGDGAEDGEMEEEQPTADATITASPMDDAIMGALDHQDFLHSHSGQLQQIPEPENSEAIERREVWSQPREEATSTDMDADQAEAIRTAMAGFTLPLSSHPEWAKVIPEDEWKAKLFSNLHTSSGHNGRREAQPKEKHQKR